MSKKNRIAIFIISICLMLSIMFIYFYRQNRIELKISSIEFEIGEDINLKATDVLSVTDEQAEKVSIDLSSVDNEKLGEYEVIITFEQKQYVLIAKIVDTVKPVVEFKTRHIFTNDLSKLKMTSFGDIIDETECVIEIGKYELISEPQKLTNKKIENMEANLDLSTEKKDEVENREENHPTNEGIYSAVLTVTDEGKNQSMYEVIIIYDITAPIVDKVDDIEIELTPNEFERFEKTFDASDCTIKDNFEEKINQERVIVTSKIIKDEINKQVYNITITYTDKAGNVGKSTYLYTVKRIKQQNTDNKEREPIKSNSKKNTTTESSNKKKICIGTDENGNPEFITEEEWEYMNSEEYILANGKSIARTKYKVSSKYLVTAEIPDDEKEWVAVDFWWEPVGWDDTPTYFEWDVFCSDTDFEGAIGNALKYMSDYPDFEESYYLYIGDEFNFGIAECDRYGKTTLYVCKVK